MKQLIHKLVNRSIDWVFRPRNPGLALIKYGASLLVVTWGFNFIGQFFLDDGTRTISLKLATGEGPPMWATFVMYGLGSILIVGGMVIAAIRAKHDFRKEFRQRLIVVELRGLHSSPDTPATNADFGSLTGERVSLPVDFRPLSGASVDPNRMLERIGTISPMIETLTAGRDKSDVFVAVGGLAAVSGLFLTGMLLDDESHITLYDWERNDKEWRLIEGDDDGKRFHPLDTSALPSNCTEVLLAVAVSYPIDMTAVHSTFPQLPVAKLTAQEVLADRYWSPEKQQALVVSFRDSVQELMARGVQKIHLILAAPSSPTIRMGMAYDKRLMPDLVVYQYERTESPPYPWGVHMPTHGRVSASIVAVTASNPAEQIATPQEM